MIRILLYDLLAKKRLSQRELSRMTGIRANTISDMCNEIAERVSLDHLNKIVMVLKLQGLDEIIRWEPDAPEDAQKPE